MTNSDKTLQIVMQVKDMASKTMKSIGGAVVAVARKIGTAVKNLIVSPFKLARLAILSVAAALSTGAVLGYVEEVGLLSARIGVSTEMMSSFAFAARQIGLELDVSGDALETLAERIVDAAEGSEDARATFQFLGVSVRDAEGNIRRVPDVLNDVAKALSEVDDRGQALVAADRLFGGSGRNILPILGNLKELTAAARTFGQEIGEHVVEQARQFQGSMRLLGETGGAAFRAIVLTIAERLLPWIEEATKFIVENRDTIVEYAETVLTYIAEVAKSAFAIIIDVYEYFVDTFGSSREKLQEELEGINAQIAEADRLYKKYEATFNLRQASTIPRLDAERERKKEIEEQLEAMERQEKVAERLRKLSFELDKNFKANFQVASRPDLPKGPVRVAGDAGNFVQANFGADQLQDARDFLQQIDLLNREGTDKLVREAELAADQRRQILADFHRRGLISEEEYAAASAQILKRLGNEIEAIRKPPGQGTNDDGNGTTTSPTGWPGFWAMLKKGAAESYSAFTDLVNVGARFGNLVGAGLNGLSNAFASVIDRTKTANRAWKDLSAAMLSDLARIISRLIVIEGLSLFTGGSTANANGNAFDTNGQPVTAFANGGILNGPTFFRANNRLNVAGEAGAEAIMPLRRGPGGRLGVDANGMGGGHQINVNLTIQAFDTQTSEQVIARHQETISNIVKRAIATEGDMRQTIREVRS